MQARQEWSSAKAPGRERPGMAGDLQRRQAGLAPDPRPGPPPGASAHHVQRALHRIGRHRHAAGQRLQHHQAEGVGAAGKDEDVAGRHRPRPAPRPTAAPRNLASGYCARQRVARRAVADHHLGAGQIEREEGLDVLLDRDAADIEPDRPCDRAARRPGSGGTGRCPRRATRCAHCWKPCALQFALQRRRSPPSSRWPGRGTSAASDRPALPATKGKRAWTYSGKRVWNEVVKAMPCFRQIARAPTGPACLRWRYAWRRARIRGFRFSSAARGNSARRISG